MTRVRFVASVFAVIAAAALPATASAADPVGSIRYPEDANGPDEASIYSYSWGLSQSATSGYGGGGGSRKVQYQDFHFTKEVDNSTPVYWYYAAKGKHLRSARVDLGTPNLSYCFTDVTIAKIQDGAPSADFGTTPVEDIALRFSRAAIQVSINTKQGGSFVVATIDLRRGDVTLGSTDGCPHGT